MPTPANSLNITQLGYCVFDGVSVFTGRTFQAGPGITITNASGVAGNSTISMTNGVGDLHVARYIVSAGGATDGANYTTITSAYAAAVGTGSPQTVFVQPGTYTENLTLSPNVNIVAFACDAYTPTVTIIGKVTMTAAGNATISGIRLQSNGDYCVEVTGSNAVNLLLVGCYLNATNANAIHCTNSSGGITLYQCFGYCSTNTFFVMTAGGINARYSFLTGNNTTTNSSVSGGSLVLDYTYMSCPITSSGTGAVGFVMSQIVCANTTSLTHGGSGSSTAQNSRFESGTSSAVSIGATLTMVHCTVDSTNANAITGAGTLKYGFIVFTNSSSTVNTNTQTALATLI
jgi:hypothetical protein